MLIFAPRKILFIEIKNKQTYKMDSTIVKKTSKSITIQVTIPVEGKDMLTKEDSIQIALNEAGKLATEYVLSQYDTDGSRWKSL
jgi:hypothetical protein